LSFFRNEDNELLKKNKKNYSNEDIKKLEELEKKAIKKHVKELLDKQNEDYEFSKKDIEDLEDLKTEFDKKAIIKNDEEKQMYSDFILFIKKQKKKLIEREKIKKMKNFENIISKSTVIHKNKLDSIQTLFDKIQEKIEGLESDISRRLPSNEENQSNKNTWLKQQIEPLQEKLVNVKEKLNRLKELFDSNKQKINSITETEYKHGIKNIRQSVNNMVSQFGGVVDKELLKLLYLRSKIEEKLEEYNKILADISSNLLIIDSKFAKIKQYEHIELKIKENERPSNIRKLLDDICLSVINTLLVNSNSYNFSQEGIKDNLIRIFSEYITKDSISEFIDKLVLFLNYIVYFVLIYLLYSTFEQQLSSINMSEGVGNNNNINNLLRVQEGIQQNAKNAQNAQNAQNEKKFEKFMTRTQEGIQQNEKNAQNEKNFYEASIKIDSNLPEVIKGCDEMFATKKKNNVFNENLKKIKMRVECYYALLFLLFKEFIEKIKSYVRFEDDSSNIPFQKISGYDKKIKMRKIMLDIPDETNIIMIIFSKLFFNKENFFMVIVDALSMELDLLETKPFSKLKIEGIVSKCFRDVRFKKIKISFVSISSNGQSNQIPLNLSNMVKLFNKKDKLIALKTQQIKQESVKQQHTKETKEQMKERLQAEHKESEERTIQKQKAEQGRVEMQRKLQEQLEIRDKEIKLEEKLKRERNETIKNLFKSQIIKLKLQRLDSKIKQFQSYFTSSNKDPKQLRKLVSSIVKEFELFLTSSENKFFAEINTKSDDEINKKFRIFIARLIGISIDNSQGQESESFSSNQGVFNRQRPAQAVASSAVASSAVASSAENRKTPEQMIQKFLKDYHFTDASRNASKTRDNKLKPLIYDTKNTSIKSSLERGRNGEILFDKEIQKLEDTLKKLNKENADVEVCIKYLNSKNTTTFDKFQKASISGNLKNLGKIQQKLSQSIFNLSQYKETIETLKTGWKPKQQTAQSAQTSENKSVQNALNSFM